MTTEDQAVLAVSAASRRLGSESVVSRALIETVLLHRVDLVSVSNSAIRCHCGPEWRPAALHWDHVIDALAQISY